MATMTIKSRMDAVGLGMTTTINDVVVTRWSPDRFEIGTINGMSVVDRDVAIQQIKGGDAR